MAEKPKITAKTLHKLTRLEASDLRIYESIPGSPLMEGELMFSREFSGIDLHVSKGRELQDATTVFERPPSLSFTFMLQGSLQFVLGNTEYTLETPALGKAMQCAVICLNQPELIGRKIRKNAELYKLNVAIEKDWLIQRCRSEDDRKQLEQIFGHHKTVLQWDISNELRKKVHKLLSILSPESLMGRIYLESYTTDLLFHVLSELKAQLLTGTTCTAAVSGRAVSGEDCMPVKQGSNFRLRIQHFLEKPGNQRLQLNALAKAFNMSVSTLQRQFKKHFDCTIADYIRRRRLEQARLKLIQEDITLDELAVWAGYAHTANFITAFRKAFAMTPYACKRQYRN